MTKISKEIPVISQFDAFRFNFENQTGYVYLGGHYIGFIDYDGDFRPDRKLVEKLEPKIKAAAREIIWHAIELEDCEQWIPDECFVKFAELTETYHFDIYLNRWYLAE